MNPFRSNGGAELARAPWSRHQATAAFAMHVGNALSLVLGAKACDQGYHMAVVLAVKKDGLVLPGSRQEGRRPGRSAAVATVECCVALAFTSAPRTDRACPSVWSAHLIYERSRTLPALPLKKRSSLTAVGTVDVPRHGPS